MPCALIISSASLTSVDVVGSGVGSFIVHPTKSMAVKMNRVLGWLIISICFRVVSFSAHPDSLDVEVNPEAYYAVHAAKR